MKIEEAKQAMKEFNLWEATGWSKSEIPNSYSLVLAKTALEKQIPKQPTPETIDEETGAITESECPTCRAFAIKHEKAIYCYNCGQRLK